MLRLGRLHVGIGVESWLSFIVMAASQLMGGRETVVPSNLFGFRLYSGLNMTLYNMHV